MHSRQQFSVIIKIPSEIWHRDGGKRNARDLRTEGLTSQMEVLLARDPAFDLFIYLDKTCLKNTLKKTQTCQA